MTTFYLPLDKVVRHAVQDLRTPFFNEFFKVVTLLGDKYTVSFLALVSLVLFLVLRRHTFSRMYALVIALSPLLGEVLIFALKHIVDRKRPPLIFALITERSPSFPSGHAFAAWSFYAVLTFILLRNVQSRSLRICVWVVTGFFVAAIGFSRIYLGVHWLSDVLTSTVLGAAWLTGVVFLLRRYAPISSRKQ